MAQCEVGNTGSGFEAGRHHARVPGVPSEVAQEREHDGIRDIAQGLGRDVPLLEIIRKAAELFGEGFDAQTAVEEGQPARRVVYGARLSGGVMRSVRVHYAARFIHRLNNSDLKVLRQLVRFGAGSTRHAGQV